MTDTGAPALLSESGSWRPFQGLVVGIALSSTPRVEGVMHSHELGSGPVRPEEAGPRTDESAPEASPRIEEGQSGGLARAWLPAGAARLPALGLPPGPEPTQGPGPRGVPQQAVIAGKIDPIG